MQFRFKKLTSLQIIMISAVMVFVLFLGKAGIGYAGEKSARKDGRLEIFTLTLDDFQLSSLIKTSKGTVATDGDPQLILNGEMYVTNIKFYMDSIYAPGDIVVYYMTDGDAGFNERHRTWAYPVPDTENWYEIEMPLTHVMALRIDPTIYAGNRMEFGDFIFNLDASGTDYFDFSASTVFYFTVYTAIAAAILKFIQELLTKSGE